VFTNAIEVSVTQEIAGRLVTIQELASVSVIRPLSELDIARVQVLPTTIQVEPKSRVNLIALALDRSGVLVPDADLFWEMLNADAGVIDEKGWFTSGLTEGSYPAAIRVVARKPESPDQTAVTTVSVEIISLDALEAPSKVALYPQSVSLRPGDAVEFRALVLDQRGNFYEDLPTSWSLNNSEAGTLDPSGQFLAGATPGTYPNLIEVTVTTQGEDAPVPLKAAATVTVLEPIEASRDVQMLLLTPLVLRLEPNESQQLTAKVISQQQGVISPADARWSGQEGVVEVTNEGVVTAIGSPGTYLEAVRVEITEGEDTEQVTRTETAAVIIIGPLTRVEIFPKAALVAPKQLSQFTFLAFDANGTRLFNVSASWELLDEGTGTITNTGLFIAGENPGEYEDVIRVIIKPIKSRAGGG
jgi:hypothetical protein